MNIHVRVGISKNTCYLLYPYHPYTVVNLPLSGQGVEDGNVHLHVCQGY